MKTVCLTFDDGLQSHYDFVRPLLKKNNLKGTFFITDNKTLWSVNTTPVDEREGAMNIECLKKLESDGFEIGNHTVTHPNLKTTYDKLIREEVQEMTNKLQAYGLKKPTTFCYPSYHSDSRVQGVLRSMGFKFARTGYVEQDSPLNFEPDKREKVYYYTPQEADKMSIKSTGIFNDTYGFTHFVADVEKMPVGSVGIFTFHGFAKQSWADEFTKIVGYIVENNIKTINFEDLPDDK
jgi:peptidoglycan/xylan/chitin deacetylase (PgdA/CDA1 family)